MKPSTKKAITKYTEQVCLAAYRLNLKGEGASSISLTLSGVSTTRQADAAINAGRDLVRCFPEKLLAPTVH
jgi:hypothetical protein